MQISLLFSALQCVITLHNSVCWATFFSCYFLYPVLFVFVFFRVMFYSRCLLLRSLMKWTHTHTHTRLYMHSGNSNVLLAHPGPRFLVPWRFHAPPSPRHSSHSFNLQPQSARDSKNPSDNTWLWLTEA